MSIPISPIMVVILLGFEPRSCPNPGLNTEYKSAALPIELQDQLFKRHL